MVPRPSGAPSSPLRPTRRESMAANLVAPGPRTVRATPTAVGNCGGASDTGRTPGPVPSVPMRLGLNLGYVTSAAQLRDNLHLAVVADQLGYDVVWAAEAYGWDAAPWPGAIAPPPSRIGIGSAVFQIPGRTPAMTAMTAATLDAMSDGRFRLGLGVSGPQVSEGWHGVQVADPLGRTREYVQMVQQAIA